MPSLSRRAFLAGAFITATLVRSHADCAARFGSLRLACGRRIAYAEYGDPAAKRVIAYHHGIPSCRREAEILLPALACRPDVRIVSFDRPGIGCSDPAPTANYCAWVKDLTECLDTLGVSRFSLAGTSAGTPYMLATALALPQRVDRVAIAVPTSSLSERHFGDPLGVGPRLAKTAALLPNVTRLGFLAVAKRVSERPELARRYLQPLTAADEKLLENPQNLEMIATFMRESARQGGQRLVDEMAQLTKPWGLCLRDVAVPTTFFLAGDDHHWPSELSEAMAKQVPCATIRRYRCETHYSLPVNHAAAILNAAIG